MGSRQMVDAVTSATRSAPLQRDELRYDPFIVEQVNCPTVEEREQILIEFRLGPFGWLVIHSVLLELLTRPLSTVPITVDFGAAVLLDEFRIFLGDGFRRERWSRSLTASRISVSPSLCAMANVMASELPPEVSTKAM